MLNQEVSNRWKVMTGVVETKKSEIDNVHQKLKQYEDAAEKVKRMLNRAETTLASPSELGADVNKAKANRDTVKVSRNSRSLSFASYVHVFNTFTYFIVISFRRYCRCLRMVKMTSIPSMRLARSLFTAWIINW